MIIEENLNDESDAPLADPQPPQIRNPQSQAPVRSSTETEPDEVIPVNTLDQELSSVVDRRLCPPVVYQADIDVPPINLQEQKAVRRGLGKDYDTLLRKR